MKSMSGIEIPWLVDQQKMHETANDIQGIHFGNTDAVKFDVWHTQQVHTHRIVEAVIGYRISDPSTDQSGFQGLGGIAIELQPMGSAVSYSRTLAFDCESTGL